MNEHYVLDDGSSWDVSVVLVCSFVNSFYQDGHYEIKRRLLLGRKAMTNLAAYKKQRHHFADKDPHSQSYGFFQ